MKFLPFWFVFLLFCFGNGFAHLEREQGHFRIADSSGLSFIAFRVTAYDSVSVTSFENADTHVDNEFVGRLRYLGKLGSDFTFNGLIQVELSSLSCEEDNACSCEHYTAEYEEDGCLLA